LSTLNPPEGLSCAAACELLKLSVSDTLAARLALILLKWSMRKVSGLSLGVVINSSNVRITVSRHRRSSVTRRTRRPKDSATMEEAGFGSTVTMTELTDQLPPDALWLDGPQDSGSPTGSRGDIPF